MFPNSYNKCYTPPAYCNYDYNCYHPDGPAVFTRNSCNYNFSGWQFAGQDANSFTEDPRFTNSSGSYSKDTDFQLQSDSPAIDAGKDVGLTEDSSGTTDPAPGSYSHPNGSTVSVNTVPNTDYRFSRWNGDAPSDILQEFIQVDAYQKVEGVLSIGGYSNIPIMSQTSESLISLVFKARKEFYESISIKITNTYDDIENSEIRNGTVSFDKFKIEDSTKSFRRKKKSFEAKKVFSMILFKKTLFYERFNRFITQLAEDASIRTFGEYTQL